MKPTASFKLSRTVKAMMASIVDDNQRNDFKRAMIQAQLQSMVKPPREKGKRNLGKTEVEE